MPPELRPTFCGHPYYPGTTWTWRYTLSNADVRWIAEIVTETVAAVWLENDVAVVESEVEIDSLTPDANRDAQGHMHQPGHVRRYISPLVIVGDGRDVAESGDWVAGAFGQDAWLRSGGHTVALAVAAALLPMPGDIGATSVWSDSGPATVTTDAGTFERCWRTYRIGGGSWGAARWFCDGVGTVEYGRGDAAISHASTAVAKLVRWRKGSLPER